MKPFLFVGVVVLIFILFLGTIKYLDEQKEATTPAVITYPVDEHGVVCYAASYNGGKQHLSCVKVK
jgi:hypothetical protein